MEKRDISGKKLYKKLSIKPVKHNLSHYCFIAIRTTCDNPLDFFTSIYQSTNYLFQLSKQNLDIAIHSQSFSFQSFEFQDIISEHIACCLVNKSQRKKQYLVGTNDKNSCYFLYLPKTTNRHLRPLQFLKTA